ncbi:hypothetical protein P5673_012810 [Acropora cervicornis]|uniref:Uncharacterized protein n=1 Tax=Acropora cervicornis TaxID=6130 RepID=A0AAD9V752_ACRCE|nr:hypothetical protein P5673_012810 [Acropora cervicornis]
MGFLFTGTFILIMEGHISLVLIPQFLQAQQNN